MKPFRRPEAGARPDPLFLRDEALDAAARRLRAAARALDAAAARVLDPSGIGSLADLRFCQAIAAGEATSSALARSFGSTKQAASKRARRLIEAGLLEEGDATDDGRARPLAVSEAGARALAQARVVERALMRRALARAGPEASSGFEAVLEAIASSDAEAAADRALAGPEAEGWS